MSKKLSTYEREMQDPIFKKEFKKEYRKLILSELIIALMTKNHKSVRVLAEECGLSATIITKLRSGKQNDLKLSNFLSIMEIFGYDLVLEKGKERISISKDIPSCEGINSASKTTFAISAKHKTHNKGAAASHF